MECKVDVNNESCPCTAVECERHGLCCECLKAHVSKKSLPACLRKLDWLEVVEA